MTERRNGDSGQRIQILASCVIENPAPLSMTERHGQTGIGVHDMRHQATPTNENGGHRRRKTSPSDR
jgi:hypothetical protein